MDNLLKRLKEATGDWVDCGSHCELHKEAIREIRQLRKENRLLKESAEAAILAHNRIVLRHPDGHYPSESGGNGFKDAIYNVEPDQRTKCRKAGE